MEPQANVETQPAAPSEAVISKQVLVMSVFTKYKELSQYLIKLPGHPNALHRALGYLDDSMLWVREAIECMPAVVQAPPVDNGAVHDDCINDNVVDNAQEVAPKTE